MYGPYSQIIFQSLFYLYMEIQIVDVFVFHFVLFFLFLSYEYREKSFEDELLQLFFCFPLKLEIQKWV